MKINFVFAMFVLVKTTKALQHKALVIPNSPVERIVFPTAREGNMSVEGVGGLGEVVNGTLKQDTLWRSVNVNYSFGENTVITLRVCRE